MRKDDLNVHVFRKVLNTGVKIKGVRGKRFLLNLINGWIKINDINV